MLSIVAYFVDSRLFCVFRQFYQFQSILSISINLIDLSYTVDSHIFCLFPSILSISVIFVDFHAVDTSLDFCIWIRISLHTINSKLNYFREIRKRSYAETTQFQENFEVYIQALISQCLDANFLDEVFNDQGKKERENSNILDIHWIDFSKKERENSNILEIHWIDFPDEYFVSNIEKVDSVTLLRKDKVMNGVSWTLRFQQALNTWPCLNDLGAAAVTVRFLDYFSSIFVDLWFIDLIESQSCASILIPCFFGFDELFSNLRGFFDFDYFIDLDFGRFIFELYGLVELFPNLRGFYFIVLI